MLSFRSCLRTTLECAVLLALPQLAGCGNSCFAGFSNPGFSNNGNGGLIFMAGNPPLTCSLSQVHGIMKIVAVRTLPCDTCSPSGRIPNIFVTVRGIQLRRDSADEGSPADWLEIAPQLASTPRELDLTTDAAPQVLVQTAIVPAGAYREVRLQFLSDTAQVVDSSANRLCGNGRWNCVLTANGRSESLQQPELLLPLEYAGNSLLVWPDSQTELRISLTAVAAGPYLGNSDAGMIRTVLMGQAVAVRRLPEE